MQLITRTESLSGDDDLAPARPTLIHRHWATARYLSANRLAGEPRLLRRHESLQLIEPVLDDDHARTSRRGVRA